VELAPEWVVPPLMEFAAYGPLALRLEEVTGCVQARGQCAALCWLIGRRDLAPITGKVGPVTRDAARAESLLALCVAVAAVAPVEVEVEVEPVWELVGGAPRPLVEGDGWWAHGVWRTLSWSLGERSDPPIQLPVLAEDGSICPGTEVYAVPGNPDSPLWRGSEARREQWELAEAYRCWRGSSLAAYAAHQA
jgi:hypothetical protein